MLLAGGSNDLAGVVLRAGGSNVLEGELLEGVLLLFLLGGVYSLDSEGVNTLLMVLPTPFLSLDGVAGLRESKLLTGAVLILLLTPVLFSACVKLLGLVGTGL